MAVSFGVSLALALEKPSIDKIKTFLGYYELENPELSNAGCYSGNLELGGEEPNYTLNFSGNPLVTLFSSESDRIEPESNCKDQIKVSFAADKLDYQSIVKCDQAPKNAVSSVSVKFDKGKIEYTQVITVSSYPTKKIECKLVLKENPNAGKLEPELLEKDKDENKKE